MASLTSPIFKGKYNKAISFSGGMTLSEPDNSREIFAKAMAPLVVEDKKKENLVEAEKWLLEGKTEVKDYLYGISAERLAPLMGNAGIRMSVFPHLYKDGYVIPKEGFDDHKRNDVPLMLVTGTSEFSLFSAFDKTFAKDFMSGTLFKDPLKRSSFTYAKNYGSQLYRLSNGVDSARYLDKSYKSDIFVSEISYGDDQKTTPKLAQSLGSFHGIFEPMLQKPSNYAQFIGDSFDNKGAKEMSKQFKNYLKNFIAEGNPNGKTLPEWKEWKEWDKDNQVLSVDANKKNANIISKEDKETADDILTKMKEDQTLSEEAKEEMNKTVLNGRWFSAPIDSRYGE